MIFYDDQKYPAPLHCCLPFLFIPVLLILNFATAGDCKMLFKTQSFAIEGKTLAVIPADIDGKGPAEIVVASKTGIYPSEQRWISIFSADDLSVYGATPLQQWEVDHDAGLFEVGDVAPSPGKEILFPTSRGVRYYGRKDDGLFSIESHSLFNIPAAMAFPAAGSLPRGRLLSDWKGNCRQMILVPQFGAFVFFGRDGSGVWHVVEKISTRPRTFLYGDQQDDGILKSYSLRLDYRLPRICTADFNGDKKGAGWDMSFLAVPAELNGDGFTDILLTVSRGMGSFLERKVDIFVFFNKKKLQVPFSDKPDQTITFYGVTPGIRIMDINRDGLNDLLFSYIKLGFWNTVKNLVSKQVNVYTSVYLLQKNHPFSKEPDFHIRTKYHLDLTRGISFNGIWPSLEGDYNGNGYPDLLTAHDGKLKIFQTRKGRGLFSDSHHQADVITCPFKHIMDLNGDGLDDLVFYEKKWNGTISVLVNKGQWEDRSYQESKT